MAPRIDTDFPGGSIDVVRLPARGAIELALRTDSASDVRQWFAFRLDGATRARELVITNAGDASFPNGWPAYRAMTTVDGRRWRRAPTTYDGGSLVIRHEPACSAAVYAYFATYPVARLDRLLARIAPSRNLEIDVVGESVQGRVLPVLRFGAGEQVIWLLGRQHPGEAPASFLMDGLARRLAREGDDAVAFLLERATVNVAPLVDLDGVELGNMRTNAAGRNLNRAWDDPDPDDTPEVAALVAAMEATGVDLFLDVHADESSPFAFAAGSEGNPGVTDAILGGEALLRSILEEETVEFVDEPFYPIDEPGEADLSCASNQIGERFGCPALTLELPIKDCGDERVRPGWSPARAERFGAALVDVLGRYLA
ncbi:MAG: hypothetical protein JNL21_41135 [Myxococcales bacterium]|nr:hypothetical protein [Myxococcales bacterium]